MGIALCRNELHRAVIEFWDAVSAFATTARTALHP